MLVYKRFLNGTQVNNGPANSFYINNDDNSGYFISATIATNGGQNFIFLNCDVIFSSWTSHIDWSHSDIAIAKDTMLYVLSGDVLLKSSPTMTSVRSAVQEENPVVIKYIASGRLCIKSTNDGQKVLKYEIFNQTGCVLTTENLNSNSTEFLIDISALPKSVYFIRLYCSNNKKTVLRFLKY